MILFGPNLTITVVKRYGIYENDQHEEISSTLRKENVSKQTVEGG